MNRSRIKRRATIAGAVGLGVCAVANGQTPFAEGDVYLHISNWPTLGGVVAKVDVVGGGATVLHDYPESTLRGAMSYDPYRDRLVLMPDMTTNTYKFVDADGGVTSLPNPGQVDIAAFAPTGDGRIYQLAGIGSLGFIDADNQHNWVYDTDGVTLLSFAWTSSDERMIYDAGTNSLFLAHEHEATRVTKFQLNATGTQITAPPQTVEYDAFPGAWDEPQGISAGPNGEIFVKIRAASHSGGELMFTVDPVTLAFSHFASVLHDYTAWNLAATYSSTHDIAVAVDTWNNVIRTFIEAAGNQSGTIIATGVSGSGQVEQTAMVSIGDSINGFVPPSPCADTNGDNTVDVADLLGVLGAWGTSDPTYDVAPPGGDGIVDVQDLLEVLAAWGPCP